MTVAASAGAAPPDADAATRPRLAPLWTALVDLKRLRSAQTGGMASTAEVLFEDAAARLAAGEDADLVREDAVLRALAGTVMGPMTAEALAGAGMEPERARAMIVRQAREVADRYGLDAPGALLPPPEAEPPEPAWLLVAQPRAGATHPTAGRIVLEPAESHGDHCLVTAIIAALRAPAEAATDAFLLGLWHHLHNALIPDGGFAGEVALGDDLLPLFREAETRMLATLPAPLAKRLRGLLDAREDLSREAVRAFNAADAIDRVLEMAHHARTARFELRDALVDLDLVHPGPLQSFQLDVLAEAGLWPA